MSMRVTGTMPPGAEMIIAPRTSDIGAFEVQRLLPHAQRRMVGPFIFVDQMGPAVLTPDTPMSVRPHPHIGLSTVTYMFEGEIVHRDSLGVHQTIAPGAVNLMTAGRGIVHSERSDPDFLKTTSAHSEPHDLGAPLWGMQIWLAAPKAVEEGDPAFNHYAEQDFPSIDEDGLKGKVVLGSAYGQSSPIKTPHETLYLDIALNTGGTAQVPMDVEERAFLVLEGIITLNGHVVNKGDMIVLTPKTEAVLKATEAARVLVFGGAPMDGPRHIWWNFVSSSKDRIEQAKEDWREGRFPKVLGDDEWIPLP